MINRNKELFDYNEGLGQEIDKMNQVQKAFEDQLKILTEQNTNLKENANVDMLHAKELVEQISSLTEDIQMKEKIIEDYEIELGIIVIEDAANGEKIRGP